MPYPDSKPAIKPWRIQFAQIVLAWLAQAPHERKSNAMREEATAKETEEAGKSKGRRGKRAGVGGTTPAYKPDKGRTVQFVQGMCGRPTRCA